MGDTLCILDRTIVDDYVKCYENDMKLSLEKLSVFTLEQGTCFKGIMRYLKFMKDECVCSCSGLFSSSQSDYIESNPSL